MNPAAPPDELKPPTGAATASTLMPRTGCTGTLSCISSDLSTRTGIISGAEARSGLLPISGAEAISLGGPASRWGEGRRAIECDSCKQRFVTKKLGGETQGGETHRTADTSSTDSSPTVCGSGHKIQTATSGRIGTTTHIDLRAGVRRLRSARGYKKVHHGRVSHHA